MVFAGAVSLKLCLVGTNNDLASGPDLGSATVLRAQLGDAAGDADAGQLGVADGVHDGPGHVVAVYEDVD